MMRCTAMLALLLSLGCATVQPPKYDLSRDVDNNPIWTKHVDPPARLGASYWLTYALALGMAAYDVHSTFAGLDRCATCAEANPIMRPFIRLGKGATYGVALSLTVFQMEIARRMKRQHERSWAVGPAIGIGVHGVAAISNSQQMER